MNATVLWAKSKCRTFFARWHSLYPVKNPPNNDTEVHCPIRPTCNLLAQAPREVPRAPFYFIERVHSTVLNVRVLKLSVITDAGGLHKQRQFQQTITITRDLTAK
jgi:hypothetical protein